MAVNGTQWHGALNDIGRTEPGLQRAYNGHAFAENAPLVPRLTRANNTRVSSLAAGYPHFYQLLLSLLLFKSAATPSKLANFKDLRVAVTPPRKAAPDARQRHRPLDGALGVRDVGGRPESSSNGQERRRRTADG